MRPPGGICRFRIYGEFDGHWRMTLMGLEDDVACIRDITDQLAALEAMTEEKPDGV
jgi:allantoicase